VCDVPRHRAQPAAGALLLLHQEATVCALVQRDKPCDKQLTAAAKGQT
jgi:hypothetical protein